MGGSVWTAGRGPRALVCVLACGALAPATATGSTVSVSNGNHVVYAAAPGETNHLTLERTDKRGAGICVPLGPVCPGAGTSANVYRIRDTGATINAGRNCAPAGTNEVICVGSTATQPIEGIYYTPQVDISLGDGDDEAVVRDHVPSFGGAVDNVIEASFVGGDGDDRLTGGPGRDFFGRDGSGADVMVGGGGSDWISYADRAARVTIALDGSRASGADGENDFISGIESAYGGSGADLLFGTTDRNYLDGGSGNDTIFGEHGDDRIIAGGGNDRVFAGYGYDSIDARDDPPVADEVECGPDPDAVSRDSADVIASDCEQAQ